MTGRLSACVGVAWVAAVATLAAAGSIRVTPLVDRGQVFASFSAPEAFTADARAVLQSGLQLTFTYTVELRRPSTLWFDDELSQVVVAATGKYDNLTGAYQISKLHGGKVVWSDRTEQEAQARTWMTDFERVLLEPVAPLEANADYYLRVRLRTSPRATMWIWPWARDDGSGRADFAYIR